MTIAIVIFGHLSSRCHAAIRLAVVRVRYRRRLPALTATSRCWIWPFCPYDLPSCYGPVAPGRQQAFQ